MKTKNNPKILVVGDLILDHYLWGSSDRISPEAPVQIVDIFKESFRLGGAGNVVNNLKTLGSEVDLISVVGDCSASKEIKKLLLKIDVNTNNLILQKNRISSKKSRVISEQQQVLRYDYETKEEINLVSQRGILRLFKSIIKYYDVVLLSDYNKGVFTFDLTKSLIKVSKKNNKKILIDPKGTDYSKYNGAYLLTPNKKEAGEAVNKKIVDQKSLTSVIKDLKNRHDLEISLITLSEKGVAVFDNELRIHPTHAREVFDVTGAGDTILASLGYSIALNKNIHEAVHFSNLAAGVVIGKIGSSTASLSEISEYESKVNKSSDRKIIKTLKEVKLIVKKMKENGQKIVFSNGCFDIIHAGHIKYLEEAKSFGDILILGLNSDKSIRLLKGPNRPINNENNRALILSSIEAVDYVVIFGEETPYNLIRSIKPDVLVKGGDYLDEDIVGGKFSKELKTTKYFSGQSTTKIIEKIKNQ